MTLSISDCRKEVGNLAVAVFLNLQFVRTILAAIIPGFTAHGIRFAVIVSALLFLVSIRRITIGVYEILIPSVILLYYFVTGLLFPGKSRVTFFEVFSYSIMPFLLILLNADMSKVVKWTLIITSPAILVSNQLFAHTVGGRALGMVLSYSVLFSCSCGLLYLLYYRKHDRKPISIIFTLLCVPQFYYMYEMIFYGSRGPALALLVLVVLIGYFKPKNDYDYIDRKISAFVVIIAIAVTLIAVFFEDILIWFSALLQRHNIFFRSLTKTLSLYRKFDISHGRTEYYVTALRGFFREPVLGHGLDMFLENTGLIYPHNFILQLAYDGGLVMLLTILLPAVIYSIKILAEKKYSSFVIWSLLFSASAVGALFSGDLWEKYHLWYFFAYCISNGRALGHQKKNNILNEYR